MLKTPVISTEMLPTEIALQITKHLPLQDYQNYRSACKKHYELPAIPNLTFTAYKQSKTSPTHKRFNNESRYHIHRDFISDSVVEHLATNNLFIELSRVLQISRISTKAREWVYDILIYLSIDNSLHLLFDWRSVSCFCMDNCMCTDPTVQTENQLFYNVYEKMLVSLIKDGMDASSFSYAALRIACRRGYTALSALILSNYKPDDQVLDSAFCIACENGHLGILEGLVEHGYVFNTVDHTTTFGWAAGKNHVAVVKYLLDLGINPAEERNMAIRLATSNGHVEIMRLLLADPRVDPSVCQDWGLRYASMNGHIEVVKLLLGDYRIDASKNGSTAMKWALEKGHYDIARLLFTDSRLCLSLGAYRTLFGGLSSWKGVLKFAGAS